MRLPLLPPPHRRSAGLFQAEAQGNEDPGIGPISGAARHLHGLLRKFEAARRLHSVLHSQLQMLMKERTWVHAMWGLGFL